MGGALDRPGLVRHSLSLVIQIVSLRGVYLFILHCYGKYNDDSGTIYSVKTMK
jgi:hypothetical protein